MADNLLQTLLNKLGVQMPEAHPAPTPEQRKLYEEMAQREQGPFAKALSGAGQMVKGFTVSDPNMPLAELQATSPWEKVGMLGAALPIFPQKGIKGLYSRAERIAEALPEAISGGKLASILKSNASKEEIGWRGLDKVIADPSRKIAKEEVVSTLQKNPLDVKVTEKNRGAMEGWDADTTPPEHTRTTYDDYVMPGAKNYRETLIKYDRPREETGGYKAKMDSGQTFRFDTPEQGNEVRAINPRLGEVEPITRPIGTPFISHHWPNDPDTLVHVRHNERDLRNTPVIDSTAYKTSDGVYQGGVRADGEAIASVWPRRGPMPGIVPELKGQAMDLATEIRDRQPKPDVGRMLENVQSDWHQRGAHQGYTGDPTLSTRAAALEDSVFQEAGVALEQRMEEIMSELGVQLPHAGPPERDDVNWLLNKINDVSLKEGYVEKAAELNTDLHRFMAGYDQALDAFESGRGTPVPDAPFKDSWAELALKQQLLDVADRPDLNWIGIAPQSELAARGEDISPQFQDVQLPKTLEKLLKPFGGKVEKADLGIKPRHLSDPISVQPGNHLMRALELGPHGGLYQPANASQSSEGLLSFLPMKSNNGPDMDRPVDIINDLKNQIINQRPNIQAFIARLSPEMKQQIKEKGFPLLMALLAQQQLTTPGGPDAGQP